MSEQPTGAYAPDRRLADNHLADRRFPRQHPDGVELCASAQSPIMAYDPEIAPSDPADLVGPHVYKI